MIIGSVVSANLGNFLPLKFRYTYSLSEKSLALMIGKKIQKTKADIYLMQEVWDFPPLLFSDDYDFIGYNDTIAVKRSFAKILRDTFKSHSIRFKKGVRQGITPDLKNENDLLERLQFLEKMPYNGEKDYPLGIPADFDLSSVIIEEKNSGKLILLGNVHLTSGPWNSQKRAEQIRDWIIGDLIPRAEKEAEGRILLAGDFNHDELRQRDSEYLEQFVKLFKDYGFNDAAISGDVTSKNKDYNGDLQVTTNYPRPMKNFRYDHILGTCNFRNYRVEQSLLPEDFKRFKRRHPLTWWMHLDHKWIYSEFEFKD